MKIKQFCKIYFTVRDHCFLALLKKITFANFFFFLKDEIENVMVRAEALQSLQRDTK